MTLQLEDAVGHAGMKLLVLRLRRDLEPQLTPLLKKLELTWADVEPALELIGSAEELRKKAEQDKRDLAMAVQREVDLLKANQREIELRHQLQQERQERKALEERMAVQQEIRELSRRRLPFQSIDMASQLPLALP